MVYWEPGSRAAVESAFRAKLQADQGYAGLLTKNPSHPLWQTLKGPDSAQFYELGDLAEWVELPKHLPKQGFKTEEIGLGRNCILFDWLRKSAYKAVRKYKGGQVTPWQNHCFERAQARNADFPVPMDAQEVKHIAKSVAKWVWSKFDIEASDAKFSQLQAHRGKAGGVASGEARLAKNEDKRSSARLMRAKGMTQTAIATVLDVHVNTVALWLKPTHNEPIIR